MNISHGSMDSGGHIFSDDLTHFSVNDVVALTT